MNQKKASSTVYIIFLIIILLAFLSFAVDGTIILTNRVKLQNAVEMTALAAASEFSSLPQTQVTQNVTDAATNTFNLLKKDSLQSATITTSVKNIAADKKVLINGTMISQPFFLSFLGVSGVKLEAKACAQSKGPPVTANYPGINWLTVSAAYLSDILSEDTNLRDTAILTPLGDFKSASYDSGIVNFALIQGGDNQPLSLGPGGFVTMKLPVPVIDKPGPDVHIKEVGAIEGYFVFVGLDNDPAHPYVQTSKPGNGITWVNISCSGISDAQDTDNIVGAYNVPTGLGNKDKFYGSGAFDLGDDCITGTANDISMAKYIRIIDDNDESAFVITGTKYYKAMLYGEASTATAGADIGDVSVLNSIELISPANF